MKTLITLFICFLVSVSNAHAELLNRSILTVENRAYSLYDVEILLALWNIAEPSSAVPLGDSWEDLSGFYFDRKKSFLKNLEKQSPEVQRLLTIALSWPEISRLSLYETRPTERAQLVADLKKKAPQNALHSQTKKYLASAPDDMLLELADMVLKTKKAQQTRGGLRESAGTLPWYWHQKNVEKAAP